MPSLQVIHHLIALEIPMILSVCSWLNQIQGFDCVLKLVACSLWPLAKPWCIWNEPGGGVAFYLFESVHGLVSCAA